MQARVQNQRAKQFRIELVDALDEGRIAKAKRLISSGAGINGRNEFGMTPLMLAASEGRRSMVVLLLRNGANANAKDRQGRTAFDLAESRNYDEISGMLDFASRKQRPEARGKSHRERIALRKAS